jgi:ring-1,2-phenylacetyl-CoA epoxidase subunit PaaE
MTTHVAFATEEGIAPAILVASRLLAEAPTNRLWFFYGHKAGEHADRLEELLALKDRHMDRLSLGVVTDREADESELLSGTLDGTKVRALASKLFDTGSVHRYYVCAPRHLAEDLRGTLSAMGVDRTRIQMEAFEGASATPATAHLPPASAPSASQALRETQVSFVMDGRRRSFAMRTDEESILDAAARAGIELPFSCKAGVCSTCRTKLLKGRVELAQNYALEDWELEQGFILACQAHAKTPELELTYDET